MRPSCAGSRSTLRLKGSRYKSPESESSKRAAVRVETCVGVASLRLGLSREDRRHVIQIDCTVMISLRFTCKGLICDILGSLEIPLDSVANALQGNLLEQPVVNRTGLTG